MNRILIILLSLLAMITLSSVSAEEVIIQIKNGKLAEGVDITKTYSGTIGEVQITNISDDTLQIEIGNFLHLFAPVDFLKLLIDDLLEDITFVDNMGVSRPLSVNDVDIKPDNRISKIYVYELYRRKILNNRHSSAEIQCENGCYLMGIATYPDVRLDSVSIYSSVSGEAAYSPISLSGNHIIWSNVYHAHYCYLSIVSLDTPVSVSNIVRFSHKGREFDISPITYPVSVKVIDGLSGNLLSGVQMEGIISETLSGTSTVQLPRGEHTYVFSKEGYWSVNKTINVNGSGQNITVELYPSNSIFMVFQNPSSVATYPSSVADVTLTLRPIRDAYGTKLHITGIDVVKVKKNGVEIPKSADGSYIIGDVSYSADVELTFAVPDTMGDRQFIARFTASDIRGNQYTAQKAVIYTVRELPFVIQKPTSWSVGNNTLTIIEQAGEGYSVLLVLRDIDGTELWSQSAAFNAYDSQTFEIPIPAPNNYILEISAKGGAVTTYIQISAFEPIRLLTTEVEGSEGSVVSVQLEIKNPGSDVKYYDAMITGSIFTDNNTPKKTFSIAPGETKTVELNFQIPDNLEFDSYDLQVQVFEKDDSEPLFSDSVVLKITEGSFLPFGGDGDNNLLLIGAISLILLLGIGAYFRVRT